MNFHQACRLRSMNLIEVGSLINGRVVSGLLIVPVGHKDLQVFFADWEMGLFPERAYQSYDNLEILVVLDNSLVHSIPLYEALGYTTAAVMGSLTKKVLPLPGTLEHHIFP